MIDIYVKLNKKTKFVLLQIIYYKSSLGYTFCDIRRNGNIKMIKKKIFLIFSFHFPFPHSIL